MKAEIQTLLKQRVPSMSGISDQEISALSARAGLVSLAPGDFVFRSGDSCESFLILLEGEIRVQLLSSEGREVTLYKIDQGGSCVLTTSCLMGDEIYPAEAIAASAVTAIAVPRESFNKILETSASFRRYVFDGFSSRLGDVIARVHQLVFTPIDVRLAKTLLAICGGRPARITHQDLSVELGTAREVVSRHLKRFEEQGLVRLGRGEIAIISEDRLMRLAGTD